jgi:hypothetical protein
VQIALWTRPTATTPTTLYPVSLLDWEPSTLNPVSPGGRSNSRHHHRHVIDRGTRSPCRRQVAACSTAVVQAATKTRCAAWCLSRELEEKRINKELANIRSKFKQGGLSGYDKKKYVCKLLYIYILGWNVDFGHLEAVNLVSATKYSEKQIGYLAVTLFLHEEHELLHLVVNSIRKDLADINELNNCLALHAIANVGGKEMGEALAFDVHRLLISP